MQFPQPLQGGVLVQRYKRFFADVVTDDGREITAHCPNPGSMLGLNAPGARVWLSRSDDPKRKLAHTLELVEADGALVGINTLLPNRLVAEALAAGAIPELAGYDRIRREARYGEASRVDFLLESAGRPPCWLEMKRQSTSLHRPQRCWVEVKSVTLSREAGLAEFPDCRTSRGAKHLAELEAMTRAGDRAAIMFLIQRADCDRFKVAADLDPPFAAALAQAQANGVEVLVYRCDLSPTGIRLPQRIS